MKVFVDNDVLLDYLLGRDRFPHSFRIIEYLETSKIIGYTSPVVFANTFFLVTKAKNKKVAISTLRKLRKHLRISKINQNIVDKALASDFSDFEDALQYFSAIGSRVEYLITRNKKDYVENTIPIVTPQEAIGIIERN